MQTAAVSTRVIRDHEPWEPHAYQLRGVEHIMSRRAGALFLDPGLGKTAIVLEAFRELKEKGMAQHMLVIAPLRVCQLVWEQEGRKWTQFRDLTFSLLHGPKKNDRLRDRTDIHLINPEGIAWLSQQYFGQQLPYDIVTFDELPKFKNATAARSKKIRKKLSHVRYRWGLTGSPAANGYMDLFGQFLVLDDGAALGRFITYFRDQYFERDYTGFGYKLLSDGAARIEARIAPYVLRMSADDYGNLPPLTQNIINIELPPAARKQYDELKKEMILALPEGVVTAANSGAVYTKLAQMANGAIYLSDTTYAELHTAKLDALEDLVDELGGQPLLVGYEFRHDLVRLQERFPGTPTLTGLSHNKIIEVEAAWNAAWNAGEIKMLFAHPASAGHGLNLQGSGASHICWFSRPWDFDLYDQFIRRLLRQGTTATHIVNHALVVRSSIDELKGEALKDKDATQRRLLTALNAELVYDSLAAPKFTKPSSNIIQSKGELMGLKKLGFQGPGTADAGVATAPPAGAVQPRGWGAPATENGQQDMAASAAPPAAAEAAKVPKGWGVGQATPAAADEQREAINEKLRAPEPEGEEDEQPPVASRALEAFGEGVVQQLGGGATQESAAAEAATPGVVPIRGWGGAGAPPAAATSADAEKPAPKARRSAKAASGAQSQGSEPSASTEARASDGAVVGYGERPNININLSGLTEKAVGAALRAIADAYGA